MDIEAKTTEDAVYCLFGLLLKDLYGWTEALSAGQMKNEDVKWQLDAALEYYVTALLGLDLSEYRNEII